MKPRPTLLATFATLAVIGMTASATAHENHESDAVDTKVDERSYVIGVTLAPVSEALRTHLNLPADTGLIVQHVVEDSPADRLDIEKHDVIVRVNKSKVKSLRGFVKAVNEAGRSGKDLSMNVVSKGEEDEMVISPVERDRNAEMELLGYEMVYSGPSIGLGVPIETREDFEAMMKLESEIMKTMDFSKEHIKSLPESVQKLIREMRATSTTKQGSAKASMRNAKAALTKELKAEILALQQKVDKIIERLNERDE
jgi:membrane-associated protease RseP (regulator of RpoE activity)